MHEVKHLVMREYTALYHVVVSTAGLTVTLDIPSLVVDAVDAGVG